MTNANQLDRIKRIKRLLEKAARELPDQRALHPQHPQHRPLDDAAASADDGATASHVTLPPAESS